MLPSPPLLLATMAYLNDNAPSEEMSVVFLPARAAAVAMALSSLSSFAALAMLVRVRQLSRTQTEVFTDTCFASQLALELSEISGENILLVACTASAFAIFVVASLTLAVSPSQDLPLTGAHSRPCHSTPASCRRRSAASGSSFRP